MGEDHGCRRMYRSGCRCDKCREWRRALGAQERAARKKRITEGRLPDGVKHGTESTYNNWQCRCGPCRDAFAVALDRRRRQAEQRTTLTARQMQVVACLAKGASREEIADELEISAESVMTALCRIRRTAGVDSNAGIVPWASERGLLAAAARPVTVTDPKYGIPAGWRRVRGRNGIIRWERS